MFVGTVNEDWAVESMAGDIFLLGTHSWQIRQVEPGVVRVRDADGKHPTIPFWLARRRPAPTSCPRRCRGCAARSTSGSTPAGPTARDRARAARCPAIDAVAAAMIVDYLAAGRAAARLLPTQDDLVLERFFDETGGMQLVVHSPYGGRINRALGLALRKKFCLNFDFELQAAASDDAVVLSLGPQHSFPLDDVPAFLRSHTVQDTRLPGHPRPPDVPARWRWNLNRSLVVLRSARAAGATRPPSSAWSPTT